MIGIDLTSISRFENKDQNFIEKLLSPQERNAYISCKNKSKFLAVHWAMKEAIYKADNSYYKFQEISIIKQNQRYSFKEFNISVSYEKDFVIAMVLEGTKNEI